MSNFQTRSSVTDLQFEQWKYKIFILDDPRKMKGRKRADFWDEILEGEVLG